MIRAFPVAGRDHTPERSAYFREVVEKLSSLPGVEAVSFSHIGPVSRGDVRQTVRRSGLMTHTDAVLDLVGPGFFRTIGMRILAGREFDWRDDESTPKVAIISESLARKLFGARSPIGERLDVGSEYKDVIIVGVVNSASLWSIRTLNPPAVYIDAMQEVNKSQGWIDIRVSGEPGRLADSARRTLASMGRQYALTTETLEHHTNMILADERRLALLSTFLGALAVLLAAVGIYGVTSFAVARRTAEIGVRMALGAERGEIVRMVLGDTSRVLLAGVAAGVPASLAASRLFSGILFEVSPANVGILLGSAAVLAIVMLVAACLPARRASRIDPVSALRCE